MSLADLNAKIAAVGTASVKKEPEASVIPTDGVRGADVVVDSKNGPESSRARVEGAALIRLNLGKTKKAQRILMSLVDAINADDVEEVLSVWRRAMRAERKFYDPMAKEYVTEPDFRVQLEASKIVAAYKEGLPVARQVNLNFGHEELKDVIAAAKQSPVMMELLWKAGLANFSDVQKTGSEKTIEVPSEKVAPE